MKYFLWTLKNIAKIVLWILLLSGLMNYFGMVYGILIFAATTLTWNIILTLLQYKRLVDRAGATSVFKASEKPSRVLNDRYSS